MHPPAHHPAHGEGWITGYHSLQQIHRTRAAELYIATRATSGIRSVVKVLLNQDAAKKHIETLQTLNGNPGIAPLLDLGRTTSGEHFLVLPLYPGGSFGQVLGRSGPISPDQAVAVARSVGPALTGMHGFGLLHNAVAPENILAGSTSLITGFGSVTRNGTADVKVRGRESFLHAPPEAIRGGELTPASDVYRLASTLWTLLVGRTPFSSPEGERLTDQEYAERILALEAPPIPRRDISRSLARTLARGMAKAPEERYSSAVELASALERARTSVRSDTGPRPAETQTPPPPTVPRTPFPPQRRETGPQTPPPARGGPPAFPEVPFGESGARPSAPMPRPHEAEGATSSAEPERVKRSTTSSAPSQWNNLSCWTGDGGTSLPKEGTSVAVEAPASLGWDEADREPRWRRHLNIGAAVSGILMFALTVGSVSTARPDLGTISLASVAAAEEDEETETTEGAEGEEAESPAVTAEPSPLPSVDPPTDVALDDTLSGVTLTWTDRTGGTGSYFVLGGQQGHDLMTLARTGPGAVTAQVSTENTVAEYCFVVVAVEGGSAPADEVCTSRAAERAEAERRAEEEAAAEAEEEEAEEEEEEDAQPSDAPSPSSED